jgi:flagellin FlaB
MKSIKQRDEGFTGLEAAIVLIAFVVVAAVFSYVVLGAGFFTTQKSQETVYKGVEQATSNLQLIGNIYGTGDGTSINNLTFYIGLAPGAPSLDLSAMKIIVTKPGSTTVSQLTYNGAGSTSTQSATNFGSSAKTLSDQNQVTIVIDLGLNTLGALGANGKINIQLSPAVGASLPFTRTAPATLTASQILY